MADKRKIVVVGGGYAGLGTVLQLSRRRRFMRSSHVTLIDCNDYHLVCTELHRVAAGELDPERIKVPFESLLTGTGVDFAQGRVTGIDTGAKTVDCSGSVIEYDLLVVATGAEDSFYGVKGAEKNSYSVGNYESAIATRERFLELVEEGRGGTPDPVVVVGAGPTGLEVAAYMNDTARKNKSNVRIILTDGAGRVLPAGRYTRRIIGRTQRKLEKSGIELMLGDRVKEIKKNKVIFRGGAERPCSFTVWCAGVQARELSASLSEPQVGRRIKVLPDLTLDKAPEVLVMGDAALVKGGTKPLPCSAQYAVQMAEQGAGNIVALSRGQKTSRFVAEERGEFISIGGNMAVGWLGLVEIWGYDAQFVKDSILYKYLLGIGPAALRQYLNLS